MKHNILWCALTQTQWTKRKNSFVFFFLSILGSVNCLDFFPSSHSNVIMNSGVKTLESMWCYKTLLFCLQLQLDDLVQNGDKTAFKCQFSFMFNKNLFPFSNWNEHEKGSEHTTVDARHWGVIHTYIHTLHSSQMVDFLRQFYVIPTLCNDASRHSHYLLLLRTLAFILMVYLEQLFYCLQSDTNSFSSNNESK